MKIFNFPIFWKFEWNLNFIMSNFDIQHQSIPKIQLKILFVAFFTLNLNFNISLTKSLVKHLTTLWNFLFTFQICKQSVWVIASNKEEFFEENNFFEKKDHREKSENLKDFTNRHLEGKKKIKMWASRDSAVSGFEPANLWFRCSRCRPLTNWATAHLGKIGQK